MTEKELQELVIQMAKIQGWYCYHTYNSRRSAPGFPDLTAVNPKHRAILFAELKSERGRIMHSQSKWIDALSQAEHITGRIWRPSDLDSGEIARLLADPRRERS